MKKFFDFQTPARVRVPDTSPYIQYRGLIVEVENEPDGGIRFRREGDTNWSALLQNPATLGIYTEPDGDGWHYWYDWVPEPVEYEVTIDQRIVQRVRAENSLDAQRLVQHRVDEALARIDGTKYRTASDARRI